MKKMIEINVPEDKIAVLEDNKIIFKDKEPHWKSLTTFEDCLEYIIRSASSINTHNEFDELIDVFENVPKDSYEEAVCKYRMVVAALTNNEERHLTTGQRWLPAVEFCLPDRLKNCYSNKVVGKIKTKEREYLVVGGSENDCSGEGLGCFDLSCGVSASWASVGFRTVSSKEIAEHISTYFGKLIFEVQYGGVNCDWEWVD